MILILILTLGTISADFATPSSQFGNDNGDETCHCVPSHLCSDNDVSVNGQGELDVRLEESSCKNYFEVCCENPLEEPVKSSPQPDADYKGCGYQTPMGAGPRITSDSQNSLFGELPWSIAILVRDVANTERNKYKCGGSIIHPQVVLTAAHCVYTTESEYLTVRAGELNTRSQDEPLPYQDRAVLEILIHPHYHRGSLRNDIALLFLAEPLIPADNVGIICLSSEYTEMDEARCIAGGWGKHAFKKGKYSHVLKKVNLPLVPRDKCVDALRSTRLGAFYVLHKSFICAGGEKNKDTCKGDGGSALVCPVPEQENRFLQMGIVSWGIGCGETQTPGVYVNVPMYVDWIEKQLLAKDLDPNIYKI